MALTELQRKKIEDEEAYRAQIRDSINPHPEQKYGFPALLSFFIPGLGQMVKGQILRGVLIFFGTIIGYMFLVIPGIIIHIWQIVDAYNNNVPKKPINKKGCLTSVIIAFIALIIIMIIPNIVQNITNSSSNNNFQQLSANRFKDLEKGWKEDGGDLDRIECFDGDCTSVVYFYFNRIPDDLDFVIRGNTATFSNFKLQNTGVSNVTIIAVQNNRVLLQCNGSRGIVTKCK